MQTLVFEENANLFVCRKLAKIAENWDRNIDPWSPCLRRCAKKSRTITKSKTFFLFISNHLMVAFLFSPAAVLGLRLATSSECYDFKNIFAKKLAKNGKKIGKKLAKNWQKIGKKWQKMAKNYAKIL
jgi:hypothetical protein